LYTLWFHFFLNLVHFVANKGYNINMLEISKVGFIGT